MRKRVISILSFDAFTLPFRRRSVKPDASSNDIRLTYRLSVSSRNALNARLVWRFLMSMCEGVKFSSSGSLSTSYLRCPSCMCICLMHMSGMLLFDVVSDEANFSRRNCMLSGASGTSRYMRMSGCDKVIVCMFILPLRMNGKISKLAAMRGKFARVSCDWSLINKESIMMLLGRFSLTLPISTGTPTVCCSVFVMCRAKRCCMAS